MSRLVLAATLSANYGDLRPGLRAAGARAPSRGVRGVPALREVRDRAGGTSTRRQPLRVHRPGEPGPARTIRHSSRIGTLRFHHIDNDQLIAYSKTRTRRGGARPRPIGAPEDVVLMVVNLDPGSCSRAGRSSTSRPSGWRDSDPFEVHDLLTDARYEWRGPWNYVHARSRDRASPRLPRPRCRSPMTVWWPRLADRRRVRDEPTPATFRRRALVQGRGHLRAARAGLPGQRRRRRSGTSGDSHRGSTTSRSSG